MCRPTCWFDVCTRLLAVTLLSLAVAGCTSPGELNLFGRASDGHEKTSAGSPPSAPPQPPDLFMRSIASRDGALGWRQLCPDLQKLVTADAMSAQAAGQRAAEAGQVAKLSVDFVGSRSLRDGNKVRFYMLTAQMADGSAASRVYIVRTEAAGCVNDVRIEDMP